MNEEMTIEEIESRFDSEWVLIEDPRTDEQLKILGGKVLYHSKDAMKSTGRRYHCVRSDPR